VLMEGLNEVMHAAAKAEGLTVFMFNNGVLADTGGQLTMSGSINLPTSTSPAGRDPKRDGYPIKIADIIAGMQGSGYVGRVSTHDPVHVFRAQKTISDAIRCQREGAGFAFVDILTSCPTSWGMTPVEANRFQGEEVLKQNPVGVLKPLSKTAGVR